MLGANEQGRVHANLYDAEAHYRKEGFEAQVVALEETEPDIRNIGWTLGNDCPYRCHHCYSMAARRKGMDLSKEMVDRVIDQLAINGIETVNLGGNEPLYTNGMSVEKSLLPYIIRSLHDRGILVGLTTAGVTAAKMEMYYPDEFGLLNDMDISLDSPDEDEHNANRGANIFPLAIRALEACRKFVIDRSIIMCAMNWNFDIPRLERLVDLARRYEANIRINPIKTVEPGHLQLKLGAEQYYAGFSYLMARCEITDLGEPPLAAMTAYGGARGCPCGRTSFRIHSITPDGKIPVSPCVYLHDFKVGDLLRDDLATIIRSPEFRTFRQRNRNPDKIPGCAGCSLLSSCRGGCAARGYLTSVHAGGAASLFSKDPYCPREYTGRYPFPREPQLSGGQRLVHQDYLCTWIGRPR